jgi:D-alanine transaminase
MPVSPIFLNGEWMPLEQASISPLDRGFLFGDGCYEIIPVYRQKIFRLQNHLDRLAYSMNAIGIESDYTDKDWTQIFKRLASQAAPDNFKSYIYLQITRGVGKNRDHTISEKFSSTVFGYLELTEFPSNSLLPKPINVCLLEDFRWQRGDIKAIALLGSVLARKKAMEEGFDDCIFYRDNEIVETSASNLFIVEDGVVKTPPISPLLLSGITRLILLELFEKYRIPFSVEKLSVEQLKGASEVWLSSSIKELVPIISVDGEKIADGKIGEILPQIWLHWQHYIMESI